VSRSVIACRSVNGRSTAAVRVVDDGRGTSIIARGDLGLGDTTAGNEGSGIEAVTVDSYLHFRCERRAAAGRGGVDHNVRIGCSRSVSGVNRTQNNS
jgi:hypothetical protein